MGAACVCPEIGKCDFLGGAFLKEEFELGVKEEDAECSVGEVEVFHEFF